MPELTISVETYPIAGRFTISRGSRTQAQVVVVTLKSEHHVGRGECVPYARYGETIENVTAHIEAMRSALEQGMSRHALQKKMPAGAARNALDCALWDLEAKQSGISALETAGCGTLKPVITAYTLSLDTPEAMGQAAQKAAYRPILKIKLGSSTQDQERLFAVRDNAPHATLIVDANEGWDEHTLITQLEACEKAKVALIEQPVAVGQDHLLKNAPRTIPLCADESIHDRAQLEAIAPFYDVINIKLDKTGGLTEALLLAQEAQQRGLEIMIGCMVGTSLAMAPALLLAPFARFVDLDGPLLLAQDRENGLRYEDSLVYPPEACLWG